MWFNVPISLLRVGAENVIYPEFVIFMFLGGLFLY